MAEAQAILTGTDDYWRRPLEERREDASAVRAEDHVDLALHCVRKWRNAPWFYEEAIAEAMYWLCWAAARYDASKGAFPHYASRCIAGRLRALWFKERYRNENYFRAGVPAFQKDRSPARIGPDLALELHAEDQARADLEGRDERESIERALDGLQSHDLELLLRRADGESLRSIAESRGWTLGNARFCASQARKRARLLLALRGVEVGAA